VRRKNTDIDRVSSFHFFLALIQEIGQYSQELRLLFAVRACFVTPLARAQLRRKNAVETECGDLLYLYTVNSESHNIRVPGRVRETASEVMFEPTDDHVTLQSVIVDSILKVHLQFVNTPHRAKMLPYFGVYTVAISYLK
jgi:hypothetical protein